MNKNLIAGVAILSALPTLAHGSGFALIEMNARGQGNAYAGAAAYTPDASTVYFNPAGMMMLDQDQVAGALHLISPKADFDNDGSSEAASLGGGPLLGPDDDGGKDAVVPNLYWVASMNDNTKFGLGVNAPFGLETEYDDDWRGRYNSVHSDLRTVNVNPSLAYRVNDKLSIGGGLNIMYGHVDLSSMVDYGAVCVAAENAVPPSLPAGTCNAVGGLPQQADGKVKLSADNNDDISTGWNLGLMYQVSPQTSIGITYRSEIEMKVKGDANFRVPSNVSFLTAGGTFQDSDIKAKVDLPASFSFSLAHQVDKFTWLADATWTGWSSFDELRIKYDNAAQPDSVTTEDWNDTMRYSIGVDYQHSDQWTWRTGVAFDQSPVPNSEHRTSRLPGNDRTWVSLGASYMHSSTLSWDFGYSHLFIKDANIDNELESSVPTLNSTLKGEYQGSVDIVSIQMNWKY
jgi:long-chain fatty acid transport protein